MHIKLYKIPYFPQLTSPRLLRLNLLSLKAASRPVTHYNRVFGCLPSHEWKHFLSLLSDQHFAAFLRRSISAGSNLASTQHLPKCNTPMPLSFPLKWTIISGVRWKWATWAGSQSVQVFTSVPLTSPLKRTNK